MAKSYSCDEKDESLFNSFIKPPKIKRKGKAILLFYIYYPQLHKPVYHKRAGETGKRRI